MASVYQRNLDGYILVDDIYETNGRIKVDADGLTNFDLIGTGQAITPWNHIAKIVVDVNGVTFISRPLKDIVNLDIKKLGVVKVKNAILPVLDLQIINEVEFDAEAGQGDKVFEKKMTFQLKDFVGLGKDIAPVRIWRDLYSKIENIAFQSQYLGRLAASADKPNLPGKSVFSLLIPELEFTHDALSLLREQDPEYFPVANENSLTTKSTKVELSDLYEIKKMCDDVLKKFKEQEGK